MSSDASSGGKLYSVELMWTSLRAGTCWNCLHFATLLSAWAWGYGEATSLASGMRVLPDRGRKRPLRLEVYAWHQRPYVTPISLVTGDSILCCLMTVLWLSYVPCLPNLARMAHVSMIYQWLSMYLMCRLWNDWIPGRHRAAESCDDVSKLFCMS